MNAKNTLLFSFLGLAATASAGFMDQPGGINISDRLTLRPYVSLSYTYDSNIDSSKHSKSGSQWVVNPGADLEYLADNWSLVGSAYYQYHAYQNYSRQQNESSYGESLKFSWSDPSERGWSLQFTETFRQISQDDDMSDSGGRGIGRDRKELTANGVVQKLLNSHWRTAAMGDYYLLDYDNNSDKYAALYGWKRATAGGEIGFAPSPWTDFIFNASYQWYWQDNDRNRDNLDSAVRGRRISSDSKGYSVMVGLGSRATEKISYRLLGGWSVFEYGGGAADCDGFTYQASAQWKVSDTFNVMLLGSSYYQPSEREYGSAVKASTVSLGVSKSFVRDKLTATLDFAFRNEENEYSEYASHDYGENIWTTRVGLNYRLNRLFSVYGRIEYQTEESDGGGTGRGHYYDYDRWRGTVGVRLTY